MKKIIIITVLGLILLGCKSYVHVLNTNSSLKTNNKRFYIYENDTLKITYTFWQENGLMSFEIFNKSKVPIYVDWKKSSYIDNSVKLNYWVNEEKTKATSIYGSYYYDGPLLKPGHAVSATAGVSYSTKVKPERITFIPPKSKYYRTQFYILPNQHYKLSTETDFEKVPRNDKPKRKTKVYKAYYTRENSPLIFRNFLAYSMNEDFESVFFVDNEFYVSEILEMDKRHFIQKKWDEERNNRFYARDKNGDIIMYSVFEKPSSFYLKIPIESNINYR
ncbi:MAG: hypothetical protein U9R54_07000 [Bacteroidota bacterium]|nr:hypothetical protein [Bacteroidota bacterium]